MAISITFWKLAPNVSPEDVAKVGAKLMEKGLFPPKGMELRGFYICPGGKGVTITESKSNESADAVRNWLMWVHEKKDMFECYEVHPAVTVEDAIAMALGK